MVLLWQLSLFISMVTLILGIEKKSWILLLISTITFLPIAYYFSGANDVWKFVGITPIILLILTILMWFIKKKTWV
ncbi:hypothetical protein H9636_12405 [Ureibacillus sp. Re31]|uniref:Uncharacterized protein n=2 Tax=Bacillales TaxID=1385 RepID=A0A3M8HFH0_9BACI|nr:MULTISPECIES: hypothetical protein [Bacillales]MBD8027456.1 hypothetical protein [Ureibacillus galli]RND01172.1 hypothetical protein EC501_02675 [Lysinibacillus halotolerans]